ncbi:MAG: hypothetical protein GY845_35260 [Planctomycetes bacterium]|nr:hypothetical protein [Planctomycetota bacterium]
MNKEFDRKNAFSINMAMNSTDVGDAIQYLINLQGSLYIFADNSIFKILPAEAIDPKNLNPETRHSYQKIYPIGCKNSYVARTIIQAKQILDSIILDQNSKKQNILDHVWSCSELLFNCESAHYRIYSDVIKLMPDCDAIVEKGKEGTTISTLPQIEDLEGKVAIFLGNAKRFLEKTHELLSIFYGTPKSGSNFKAYREWLTKEMPEKLKLIRMLDNDKDWIQHIASLRNAHEINHAEPKYDVEITNFRLNPGNKFSNPGWRYDFSGRKGSVQKEFSDIITDMNVYLSNLLTFSEDLLMFCIIDNSNKSYHFKIYKQLPENIYENCPTIYFVSMDKNT